MTIVWSGLAPHPPIIVGSVGGSRCGEVTDTIQNMTQWADDLLAARPDRLVLISPHAPRPRTGIAYYSKLSGDFSRFGAPQTKIDLPTDSAWFDTLRGHYPSITDLGEEPMDHGATVPLYFVTQAGWKGVTQVIGLPWDQAEELDQLGRAVALTCPSSERVAIIASGDMSHCLKPGAPNGYNPKGPEFDKTFVDHIKRGAFREATEIDAALREEACQDVVESCRVAWQATGYARTNRRFYGYEGPFGVGYTVMKFHGEA